MPASEEHAPAVRPFVHLLNEIEQHDDMAYDDADQAGYSKECHEAKGRAHDCQSD